MLKSYLKRIFDIANRGDAREETYYSSLEGLLKEYVDLACKRNIHITTLPKKTEAGNPDFRIWDGNQHIVGYIEAKAPTVEDLNGIEHSEQLERYRHTFPNLILTNFFEFRLYRNGALIDKALIGRPVIMHKVKTVPPVENEPDFLKLLEKFFSFSLPRVYNAKTLAVELAKRTRFLKDEVITQELEKGIGKDSILGFYEAFRKHLISNLSKEDFADLYSQTITYGLFAARTRSENGFNRKLAYDRIPHTIGILRDIFSFISLGDLPQQMEWIIDDISEVLAITDVYKILDEHFHKHKGKDPIIHFYETFLAEYDPETREKRGVYYTPEPVVSYIVRSLHRLLKDSFNKEDGFATDSVTVLDPAAGTLTFLAEASKLAVEEFISKYGEGGKGNLISEHILKNFYAFELMMAPYAVGHLKMSFLLEELGYRLKGDDRCKFYLTNTLEMEEFAQTIIPGLASLSEESHLAGKVKKEQPILIILGNPPYSGISTNMGKWITDRIEDYKYVDGKHFGERKHWLQDDYVKFIRFAQWKIDKASEGILGFITNHSYLDNPTFRGMRQSLMNSFDEIYILDLHGNSLKKEKCPDGSKDENVFDIQQGVAIALFIKKKGKKKRCKVFHSELWGRREDKYEWLEKYDVKTTEWEKLKPNNPYYFLVRRDETYRQIYEKYWKITDIFPVNVSGIVTARDKFVIDFDKEALKSRIMLFRNENLPDKVVKQGLNLSENYMWRVAKARKELMAVNNWKEYFTKILYRPFDSREIFFHPSVVWRTRREVMRHMMQENLGLITNRQVNSEFRHALCSSLIINDCTVSSETKERSYLFPLYLYPEKDAPKKRSLGSNMMIFEPEAEYEVKKPNLSPAIVEQLTKAFKKKPTPEQIFFYIYAILYSNTYRTKYAEFLKIDFPRIPFTTDYKLFSKMGEYGERLVNLHLLKSTELDPPIAMFQGKGDGRVKKIRYDGDRVYINEEQYFEGLKSEVWQYQIGGYKVCDKWLKDRKGRELSLDDMKHYCKIVTAFTRTIKIQDAIDKIYPEVEGEVLQK